TRIDDDNVDLEIAPGVVTTWLKLAVRDRIEPQVEAAEELTSASAEESVTSAAAEEGAPKTEG
ncbi:preprotein translocase subunit YajC, partial [Mycobacterium sp. CBMA361]|nr:preprotein translocase subunit YajC [Mycolicibacterium sp. CBMA 361]